MRQQHVAGDKTFLDNSGQRPHLVEPVAGEHIPVEQYVAILGTHRGIQRLPCRQVVRRYSRHPNTRRRSERWPVLKSRLIAAS
jgi:hypothetical protein